MTRLLFCPQGNWKCYFNKIHELDQSVIFKSVLASVSYWQQEIKYNACHFSIRNRVRKKEGTAHVALTPCYHNWHQVMPDARHKSNVDWVKVILSQRRSVTTNITKRSKCKNKTNLVDMISSLLPPAKVVYLLLKLYSTDSNMQQKLKYESTAEQTELLWNHVLGNGGDLNKCTALHNISSYSQNCISNSQDQNCL